MERIDFGKHIIEREGNVFRLIGNGDSFEGDKILFSKYTQNENKIRALETLALFSILVIIPFTFSMVVIMSIITFDCNDCLLEYLGLGISIIMLVSLLTFIFSVLCAFIIKNRQEVFVIKIGDGTTKRCYPNKVKLEDDYDRLNNFRKHEVV